MPRRTQRQLDQDVRAYLAEPSPGDPILGDVVADSAETPRSRGRTARGGSMRTPRTARARDPLAIVTAELPRINPPARFGGRKVFISSVWERVGDQIGMTLDEFKVWLVEQHRSRKLRLERADFVAAMDPSLVQASEIRLPGATYHFVVDDPAERSTRATAEPTRVIASGRSEGERRTRTRSEAIEKRPPAPTRPGSGEGSVGDPLPIVLDAIRDLRGRGRFGDRKVFVSALHERVGHRLGMGLGEFKAWLLQQHFARRLTLARADLVAAMDPDLVRDSEIDHRSGSAVFHFVVDPSVR